jgi:hypothetical protein
VDKGRNSTDGGDAETVGSVKRLEDGKVEDGKTTGGLGNTNPETQSGAKPTKITRTKTGQTVVNRFRQKTDSIVPNSLLKSIG